MRNLFLTLASAAWAVSITAEAKPARKLASDWSQDGLTKEFQNAVEKHWLYKAVRSHYKTFGIYNASVEDQKVEREDVQGDKLIQISYSTYNEREKNGPEDSVRFVAEYSTKSKTVKSMTVEQGPCVSDMCGP